MLMKSSGTFCSAQNARVSSIQPSPAVAGPPTRYTGSTDFTARALATQEGIFCGISCGATFAAALTVAREATPGSVILAMLPDTGERYLSTALAEGINEGSDSEP